MSIAELAAKINVNALSGDPSKNPNNPLNKNKPPVIEPTLVSLVKADGSFNH